MAKFHVDFEDISYITDPEMDGDEASAKLIAQLNKKGEADGLFGNGILELIGARISEDDEQDGNEERKVFVVLTFLVEADDYDAAEELTVNDEFLDHICEEFLDSEVNEKREQSWEVNDVSAQD